MKFSITLIILFFMGCNSQSSNKSVSNLSSFEDSTSYSIGADLGANLKRQNVDIDYDVFLAGLIDGMELSEEDAKLNQKERREVMSLLQNRIRENEKNQGSGNLKLADEFLDKNKKDNSDIKETPTGLQYRVLKEGTGEMPKKTDRVKVHYVGRLMDGSKFDSSVDRGEPTEFGLNQVIKGWTEGITYFKEGGEGILLIPSNLGYGNNGSGPIPGGAVLVFDIKLISVN